MKHIIKVNNIQDAKDNPIRPILALDNNGNLFVEGQAAGPQMEFVDLGLSVKWAKCNLGAETETDYGDYYAWGEIETKSIYSWDTYFDNPSGGGETFIKYKDSNSSTLLPEDDVANASLGGNWRMPSKDNFIELAALPNKWMSVNGVNGRVFCKANEPGAIQGDFSIMEEGLYLYDENNPNPDSESGAYNIYDDFDPIGLEYQTEQEVNATLTAYYAENYGYEGTVDINTMLFLDDTHKTLAQSGSDYQLGSFPEFNQNTMLFIPAAGYYSGSELYNAAERCWAWSSSLNLDNPYNAYRLHFDDSNVYPDSDNDRYDGLSVRPVFQN